MNNYKLTQPITIDLINEQASELFAAQLASYLTAPLVITLQGDIGVGKTTLVRAMLRKLGISSAIKSPTFSLVESYICHDFSIHHFDLYRIHHPDELEYIGFRDYFSINTICCIEWAEHAGRYLPQVDIQCSLKITGSARELQVSALSAAGYKILVSFIGQ